jgi:hypothetical protein
MTTSRKTSLIRKLTLGAGALIISAMTLASTADAKPKFNLQLNFGGGGGYYGGPSWGGHGGYGYGYGYGCGSYKVRIKVWHAGHGHFHKKWVWKSYC